MTSERSPGLVALQAGQSWVLSLAPGIDAEAVAPLVRALGLWRLPRDTHAEPCQPCLELVEAPCDPLNAVGLREFYGPAQVLYCEPEIFRVGDEAGVRRLDATDGPRIERFRAGMGQLAWSLEDPRRWVAAFGLLDADELISAAAVQVWGDCIGEVFVDTLPQHRRRGHAKMVARAVTRWLLEETSLIPQYDAELTNLASLHVARAIGYEPYGWLFVASRS